jgi:hypothetical protein
MNYYCVSGLWDENEWCEHYDYCLGLEGEAIKAKPDLSGAWITGVKVREWSFITILIIYICFYNY